MFGLRHLGMRDLGRAEKWIKKHHTLIFFPKDDYTLHKSIEGHQGKLNRF